MATYPGTGGDDTIVGSSFRDKLFGKGGDDTLKGGGGDDKIIGGRGDDNIAGGKGDDKIIGGKGDDVLKGNKGEDTFVFGKNSGDDVIKDFDVGKDVLEFNNIKGFKNPQDVIDAAKQVGNDVVIDLGDGNSITLKKVDLDDLKKNPGDHFDVH